MKYILMMMLAVMSLRSYGQTDTAYIEAVNRAAATFLNRQLPDDERLRAIAHYPIIFDEERIRQFKATVTDTKQSPAIRAMALNKIYQAVDADEKLFQQVVSWFADPETPQPLRDETLNLIGNLSFSSITGVLDVYHKMVEDPNIRFRTFVLSKLVQSGDARAQQLLIRGLENPDAALVEPVTAIELLSFSPKPEYYPTLYKLLLQTKDELVRLSAVQSLGPYTPAREKLVSISRDANEKDEFRTYALMALYSGDKDNLIQYVTPILQDKTASPDLHTIALQMTTDVRKKMAYRKKAKKADAYDQLVKSIAEGKGVNASPQVMEAANKYLLQVRPAF